MKKSTPITASQKKRIEAQVKGWGGSTDAGLARIYGDSLNAGMLPAEAQRMVDRELAWRVAWLRAARQVRADAPVIVTSDMIGAVLAEM